MKLPLVFGKVSNHIILGGIFFLIFTPLAGTFKLFGRDELNLKSRNSNWKDLEHKNSSSLSEPF